jgi:hypothetical protein
LVIEAGNQPVGELTQTNPDKSKIGPVIGRLVGSGNWTNLQNNPMLKGDVFAGIPHMTEGMSMQWGELVVGCEAVVKEPNAQPGDDYLRLQPAVTAFVISHS